jgi:hypothetical protein
MRPSIAIVVVAICTTIGCDRKSDTPAPNSPAEIAKEAPVTSKTSPELVHQQSSLVSADSGTVSDFERRVNDFIQLRDTLDRDVSKVPDQATPIQIDKHQRELGVAVARSRTQAKQGDIFIPGMQAYIRGVVKRVLGGPEGPRIKASLMDENPMNVELSINGRYPDTIPMSTMPPDMLAALPPLGKDLEYRFVGNRLVLLDLQSHLIIDFVANTFDL